MTTKPGPRAPVRHALVQAVLSAIALALAGWAIVASPSWVEIHTSGLRCVRDPHSLSLGNFARWMAGLGALVVFFVVRPLLAKHAGKLTFGALARYGLAIALALLVSELVMRRPHDGWVTPVGYSPEHLPDPVLAWRLRPGVEHPWRQGGRDFVYATNDEGNRAESIHANSDHVRATIVVGGESIAMGMGNPYEDSFPVILEARTGTQVVDTGVDAYGLDQIYMREKEVVPLYPHLLAVVTVFHAHVAERAEVEDRPRLRVNANGVLELVPPTPEWERDLRLRKIFRGLYHSNAELDDLRALVRATADLARESGAYPLFLTTNFSEPCLAVSGQKPYIFRNLVDDQGVPRVHVELLASDRLSDDMHPGPSGQKKLADAVEAALRAAHVL